MSARKLSIDAMAHTVTIPTSSPVELLPRTGRTIGNRYRITGLIGRGGMADVYQGDDLLLERPVAIKILHRHLASDSTGLERFRREGMTLASVASANVVAIHDIGLDAGAAFLVMQYIVGHTLEQEIAQHGKMTPVRAGAVLTQILEGLAALHARGLVHRDIKPSNVMLDAADRVVLLDLGIAFDSRRSRLTNPGLIAGTPGYMAPERQSLRTVDHRSDIYQVGLLLILLITGVDPARSSSRSIDELLQLMPLEYQQVARRALSAAPHRYATVAEMARAVATAREVCKTTAIDPDELRPLIVEAKVPRLVPAGAADTDLDLVARARSSAPTLELDTDLLRALATDQSLHEMSTSLKLRPKPPTSRPTQELAVPLRPRLKLEAIQPFDELARGSGPVMRLDAARAETEKVEYAPAKSTRAFAIVSGVIVALVIALALAASACLP